MKTSEKTTEKRIYKNPIIEVVKLDNEISLALQSSPPEGPGEGASLAPEYMKNDPYKTSIA